MKTSANTSPANSARTPLWKRIMRGVLWFFTLIACLGLIVASYSGTVDPSTFILASVMLLSYPLWFYSTLLLGLIDAFLCRKALVAVILTIVVCIPSIWSYSPLNILKPHVPRESEGRTLKFMTYNVAAFHNFTPTFPGDVNPTVSFILNSDADVVNLQEVYIFATSAGEHITAAQLDSLHHIYPYVLLSGHTQALLSKYPAEVIPIDWPSVGGNEMAVFRVDVNGEKITIFDVHLQSYGLTDADKSLFRSLTRLDVYDSDKMKEIKSQLLDKVNTAAATRARDADSLDRYIRNLGGPNVIVAGDFNDVPGCYALRHLAEFGLKEVYPEVAFGPMITYNASNFYFRIDHVLYRGALKPLKMYRGKVKCSDHYPVFVEFALTGSNQVD